MEVKISTALETALEFISEVATCKEEELQEKRQLIISFIYSIEDKIGIEDKERIIDAYRSVDRVRSSIIRHKKADR